MASNRNVLEDLLRKLEPEVRDAFIAAISEVRDNIDLSSLIARLERGDIEGAIRALHIEDASFSPLAEALRKAFAEGGAATVNRIPNLRLPTGERVVIRFDLRNPIAERVTATQVGGLIREVSRQTVAGVRSALTAGLMEGKNPRTTALDIAGRINRATGRREGGLVGLTEFQVERARAYALKLATSGIPAAKAVPIFRRYLNKALLVRAETIARTETMTALSQAQEEAFRQNIESGKVDPEAVTCRWVATSDNRTRDTHRAMDGQEVAWGELFVSPSGATLRYPGDPSAPPEERINCRCTRLLNIDYLRNFR
jgi:uncharacterized protein with gpF-like domain